VARPCPFCTIPAERITLRNTLAFATWDINPVTKGHTLIIPFRHVVSFFDTTPGEQAAIIELILKARHILDERYHPDGYNIGVNIGEAAGQVIMHLHFHVIPRYRGDSGRRGSGLRHVIRTPGGFRQTLGG
jgi:diadenosine tetraphosphate (Ap4A) HIT family hydrolase